MRARIWLVVLLLPWLVACFPVTAAKPTLPAPPFSQIAAPTIQMTPVSSVQIFVRSAERSGKEVHLEVCFVPPDASDWTLGDAHLLADGEEMLFLGSTLTELSHTPGALRRCERLMFGVAPEKELPTAVLQIETLRIEPSLEEICTLYLPKMLPRLEAQGIQAKCVQSGETWQLQVISYPPSLSREQAEALIYDPANFALSGPWSFIIEFRP